MRIAVVGGGPAGLLFARLAAAQHRVTVYERNRTDDTFGLGVVFSDETLANLRSADPPTFERIEAAMRYWTEIDVCIAGRVIRSGGHGFAALARVRLLQLLTAQALCAGVELRHADEVRDVGALQDAYDLVVGADGVRSTVREWALGRFAPVLETGAARYVWLATTLPLERFTFLFRQTEFGVVAGHAYPYEDGRVSLIVEVAESVWRRSGLDDHASGLAPGESDPSALAFAAQVFEADLDGHGVIGNRSRWLRFLTVTTAHWHTENVVLLGDAAHTAHFSIGSGTKLAMEDAIALAAALAEPGGALPAKLEAYEALRRPLVASTQRAARTSQEWFEGLHRYARLPPEQFAFQLLTRSQRITHDNLRLRDAAYMDRELRCFWETTPEALRPADPLTPPMFYPFQLRSLRLSNRVVVSPMAQYCAVDGMPGAWHLVHLGARAVGGAGLVMTEMTCVAPQARITPGCTGLWSQAHQGAWTDLVAFVHEHSAARIGVQLGHAGRKGSTRVPWAGEDMQLAEGNWPLLAPSAVPYLARLQTPREMTRMDMEEVCAQFVAAARRGALAGFDLLELHMAHGYLLSSFLSPVTNRRRDDYGGSLTSRLRFPLEVFDAVRAVWPAERPMSVRISATDWIDGGFDGQDAVALARAFQAHGCDLIDVSSGQVDPAERPRHGRLWQTPFSDRIRQEVDMPTIAVGGIASVDDVNTILLAGRADLVALARPHLVDPYWTLNAAIDQGYGGYAWPVQYRSGRTARRRQQRPVADTPP